MTMDVQSKTMMLIQRGSNKVYDILEDNTKSRLLYVERCDQLPNTVVEDTLSLDIPLNDWHSSIYQEKHEFWTLSSDIHPKNMLNLIMELDVVTKIRAHGLNSIADRLNYLYKLPIDSQHEKCIDLKSLSLFAHFVIDRPQLPHPQITISPDGFINAEWSIEEYGDLSMEFLPLGTVRFSILFQSLNTSPRFINGTLDIDKAIRNVEPFMDKLMSK